MRKEVPEGVTREELKIHVSEIEPMLSRPGTDMPAWEPVEIKLKTGESMVVRSLKRDEVPELLAFLKKLMDVDHDFYDIVASRVHSEVLGWYRNRLKDPYTMI